MQLAGRCLFLYASLGINKNRKVTTYDEEIYAAPLGQVACPSRDSSQPPRLCLLALIPQSMSAIRFAPRLCSFLRPAATSRDKLACASYREQVADMNKLHRSATVWLRARASRAAIRSRPLGPSSSITQNPNTENTYGISGL